MPERIIDRINEAAIKAAWLDGCRTGAFAAALALVVFAVLFLSRRR